MRSFGLFFKTCDVSGTFGVHLVILLILNTTTCQKRIQININLILLFILCKVFRQQYLYAPEIP